MAEKEPTKVDLTAIGTNGETLTGHEAEIFNQNEVGRLVKAFVDRLEQLAKKGGSLAESIGAMNNSRSATQNTIQNIQKKRDGFDKAMRTALAQALKIQRLEQEIEQHKHNLEIADQFIEELENGKAPELDADGSLKDKERERLLREYEKRTGETVDRTNIDALLLAMREQRKHEQQQLDYKEAEVENIKSKSPETAAAIETIIETMDGDEELTALSENAKGLSRDDFLATIQHLNSPETKNKVWSVNAKTAPKIEQHKNFDQAGETGKALDTEGFNPGGTLFADIAPITERTTSASKAEGDPPIVTALSPKKDFMKATDPNQTEPQEQTLDVKNTPVFPGVAV